MQRQKSNEYALRLYTLYVTGLIAFISVILQAFLGLEHLDLPGLISVAAFAFSLPPLTGVLIVNLVEEKYPYAHSRSASAKALNVFFAIGVISFIIGVDAAFWHVFWLIGVLFLVALLATICIGMWYISNLEELP